MEKNEVQTNKKHVKKIKRLSNTLGFVGSFSLCQLHY